MPGQPARAHPRSGDAPGDSLSRIAGLPLALPQSSASSRSSHVFTADTVRQAGVVRNRKTSSACAEAVNYEDYLWKATEKIGGNLYLLVGSDGHRVTFVTGLALTQLRF